MTGRRAWRVASRAPADVNAKLSAYSPLAAQLLYNRGVTDLPSAKAFLSTDEKLLEDSLLLPDIQSAVSRINRALRDGETIGIFGDFDADGVTATALLEEGLARLGGRVIPYLPHRVKEGHGLNSQAVHALHEQGVTLLVTVDCGVTSVDEVSEAASLGMDTIITDHHTPLPRIPDACAIVNPKLDGSIYPFPHLAGVGLAFKLVTALYASMDRSWDETLLQLAALGTVTDVTPLVGENRYIVAAGLRSLNTNPRPGLKELLRLAGLEVGELDTETIAYTLGPRLNAPGRLEHASKGYDLLRAASTEEAAPLARDLERMNRERQGLTQKAQDAAKRLMGLRVSHCAYNCPLERGVPTRDSGAAGEPAGGGEMAACCGGGPGRRPGQGQLPEHPGVRPGIRVDGVRRPLRSIWRPSQGCGFRHTQGETPLAEGAAGSDSRQGAFGYGLAARHRHRCVRTHIVPYGRQLPFSPEPGALRGGQPQAGVPDKGSEGS